MIKKMNKPANRHKKISKIVLYAFGLIMISIYLGMAYLLLFSAQFENRVPEVIRYTLGAILLIYGIFRAYRLIKNKSYFPSEDE